MVGLEVGNAFPGLREFAGELVPGPAEGLDLSAQLLLELLEFQLVLALDLGELIEVSGLGFVGLLLLLHPQLLHPLVALPPQLAELGARALELVVALRQRVLQVGDERFGLGQLF